MENIKGIYVGHKNCVHCGSSDGNALYYKEVDNKPYYDAFCWVCKTWSSHNKLVEAGLIDEDKKINVEEYTMSQEDYEKIQSILQLESRGVKERLIKRHVAELYGMRVEYSPTDPTEIIAHYYPCTKDAEVTGFFKRSLPKKFSAVGDVKNCELHGQHLFDRGGSLENRVTTKFIILTEGYLDMLAASQMMGEDSKYITPVVSIPNGTNINAITDNYKFLNRFESIIYAGDQDDAGKEFASKLVKTFNSGKVKVMSFSEDDPADMLKAGKVQEFKKAFWSAAPQRPSQILTVDDIFDKALQVPTEGLSFPWASATKATLGIRRGEIHIVGAAPKIGKTEHQHQMIKHMTETHGEIVGVMSLEENPVKTLKKVAGKYAGKQFTKPPSIGNYTQEELSSSMDRLRNKIEFYSSDGVRDADEILDTVRYWASKGIWFFIVDPLTALVAEYSSSQANDILNSFMSKAASMAMELQITFFMYSHVNPTKSGKSHDEGGDVLSSQFTGSRAMEKWAHYGWGIQRNRMEKDEIKRNTARITMLFDREFGEYCEYFAFYNHETNDWSECPDPDDVDLLDGDFLAEDFGITTKETNKEVIIKDGDY